MLEPKWVSETRKRPADAGGSRSGKKREGVRTTTALPTPAKGPKKQHMADAPRSHGEPRPALLSLDIGPCGPIWRYLGKAEPTLLVVQIVSVAGQPRFQFPQILLLDVDLAQLCQQTW
jgi:hypothetical protein